MLFDARLNGLCEVRDQVSDGIPRKVEEFNAGLKEVVRGGDISDQWRWLLDTATSFYHRQLVQEWSELLFSCQYFERGGARRYHRRIWLMDSTSTRPSLCGIASGVSRVWNNICNQINSTVPNWIGDFYTVTHQLCDYVVPPKDLDELTMASALPFHVHDQ